MRFAHENSPQPPPPRATRPLETYGGTGLSSPSPARRLDLRRTPCCDRCCYSTSPPPPTKDLGAPRNRPPRRSTCKRSTSGAGPVVSLGRSLRAATLIVMVTGRRMVCCCGGLFPGKPQTAYKRRPKMGCSFAAEQHFYLPRDHFLIKSLSTATRATALNLMTSFPVPVLGPRFGSVSAWSPCLRACYLNPLQVNGLGIFFFLFSVG